MPVECEFVDHLDDGQIVQLVELYQNEWWCKGRIEADVRRMLDHTDMIFAAVEPVTRDLIGFARVLTDCVYFAVIFDVIVKDGYRKQGLGSAIVQAVLDHPDLAGVRTFELCCRPEREAFYERLGFRKADGRMNLRRSR